MNYATIQDGIQRTMKNLEELTKLFNEGAIEPLEYGNLKYYYEEVLKELMDELYAPSWADTSWDYED